MKRRDGSGHAKDKQDIEEIRSDRVAERQTAVSFSGCHNRGDKFRQGSADGDDGQSDKILADSEVCGDDAGVVDDQIAAEDDSGKSATHKEDTFRKRQYLTDLAFFTVAQGGTDHACDVENHSCQKKKTFDAAKRSIEKHEAQNQRDQNIDGHVPL